MRVADIGSMFDGAGKLNRYQEQRGVIEGENMNAIQVAAPAATLLILMSGCIASPVAPYDDALYPYAYYGARSPYYSSQTYDPYHPYSGTMLYYQRHRSGGRHFGDNRDGHFGGPYGQHFGGHYGNPAGAHSESGHGAGHGGSDGGGHGGGHGGGGHGGGH